MRYVGALGVVVFCFTRRYAPFEEPDQRTLFSKIVTPTMNSMKNTDYYPDAKDLYLQPLDL
jgi:hypothetical protein